MKQAARDCGFALAGLARAEPLPPEPLMRWLAAGYAADLTWMAETAAARLDPSRVQPGIRAVLALAIPYHRPGDEVSSLARYARGRDYHYTHRDRLKRLRKRLLQLDPGLWSYACVDTGHVMERPWAVRAGLGWVGKNGCLINPELGSWLTLSVMFLNRDVDAYDTPGEDLCGSCDRCLKACPTEAFPEPRVVDARKCIAYHSIENRGAVPRDVRPGFRAGAFGCDICQEVCPYNRRPVPAFQDPAGAARPLSAWPLEALATLSHEDWERLSPGTALPRIGYVGLRRNAVLALGAARKTAARTLLEALRHDPEPQVAEAADWALARLLQRTETLRAATESAEAASASPPRRPPGQGR